MSRDYDGAETGLSPWLRLLWMFLFFLLLFYGVKIVVLLAALCQFVLVLINGAANERLRGFSGRLNRYAYEILEFLSFRSSRKPFPFSEFPDS